MKLWLVWDDDPSYDYPLLIGVFTDPVKAQEEESKLGGRDAYTETRKADAVGKESRCE